MGCTTSIGRAPNKTYQMMTCRLHPTERLAAWRVPCNLEEPCLEHRQELEWEALARAAAARPEKGPAAFSAKHKMRAYSNMEPK
jgi:hypothetical protein